MIVKLNFDSEIPIYVQLRNQIVVSIGKGDLKQGEKLPTVRQLAEDLGINTMTVNKSYGILKSEGFISIDRRHGAKINSTLTPGIDFKEKLDDELSLVISEVGLKGIEKKEFMDMCEKIFSTMKGIKA
ncbi:GntR family transcriptional regulator [Romboutsia weinsteinii]|uniref:GntR family transcriptional regulator n=1 Tax=Romboutsia weinsteinii TaxID=2020949 RepID=A0A371J5I6_9FIRM|nr:GntR family transcriptional regulator [Romboutsia weinsteinii]RDY28051.1 GntR family transcriptional regulator [Romboutsia weinsteinii]